ncbi:MafI family immunity protein [Xanthomonas prunicola]|uniref:MafI family immunity protein n=1 Tax=Xanthomonas prunicola TaxID=2053930 RepID=UPI0021B26FE1|nr:MafI family immunity protein [Xanthomonas prunicola]UXA51410.1 MafI family immunity protein [Xanthomonas prunicola]
MTTIKIISFTHKFSDRLNRPLIEGILDYVDNSEAKLAFEILCDHLSEYEINISSSEYDEATELALQLGFEMKNPPFKYLEQLKNDGGTNLT